MGSTGFPIPGAVLWWVTLHLCSRIILSLNTIVSLVWVDPGGAKDVCPICRISFISVQLSAKILPYNFLCPKFMVWRLPHVWDILDPPLGFWSSVNSWALRDLSCWFKNCVKLPSDLQWIKSHLVKIDKVNFHYYLWIGICCHSPIWTDTSLQVVAEDFVLPLHQRMLDIEYLW